jgi:LPS-assembly protein
VLWSPYLVLPVKSQRQTGFLFPKFGASTEHGYRYIQPFFWAINRSADMTLSAGRFSRRGNLAQWEGRYALSPISAGAANVFFNKDFKAGSPREDRWGLKFLQRQELPFGIDEKMRFLDVSDNLYPIDFSEDMPVTN